MTERLRYRLARWLVGPFFPLPSTGSWIVNRDVGHNTIFGIRLTEWQGTMTTDLAPLDYDDASTGPGDFKSHRTTGKFTGTFG